MSQYSIKELEVLTGIKSHTIRIWEQRYQLLEPNRTDTNIRYYTEEDLRHLLNVSLLNKNGVKISHLAKMSAQEIRDKVLAISENNHAYINQIDALVLAMITYNDENFEKTLNTNILRIGFEKTFVHIIFPLLKRIGVLWQTAVIRPAQEHFISNLIRQKIIVAIDGQMDIRTPEATRFLLFLPEKEWHELSLLFLNFLLRSRSNRTLYLGCAVPFDDIQSANDEFKAHYIVTVLTSAPKEEAAYNYLKRLSDTFPGTRIIATGQQVINVRERLPDSITVLDQIEDSIRFADQFRYYINPKMSVDAFPVKQGS